MQGSAMPYYNVKSGLPLHDMFMSCKVMLLHATSCYDATLLYVV